MRLAGYDVETSGRRREYALQPYRARSGDAWLTSFAVATQGHANTDIQTRAVRGPEEIVEPLHQFLQMCAARRIRLVGWNVAFDAAWAIALGLCDEVFACQWLDAMLLYRHVTCSPEWTGLAPQGYGLKEAVARFIPDEAGYDDGIDFEDMSEEGIRRRLVYNRKDAGFSLWFARKFLRELTPAQARCALIEAACIPMVAETLVEGIYADGDAAAKLSEELERTASIAFVKLKLADGDVTPQLLASPKQLRDLLFKKWGLPIVKMTKPSKTSPAGNASTDKDALDLLGVDDERAKLLHTYREATGNRTKFAEGTLRSLDYNGDGYIRPAFRIFGTYTGRGTYSSKQRRKAVKAVKGVSPAIKAEEYPVGVALHQWKRDKDYRAIILPPPGYTLIEWDFAGQEYRWMAVESEDPKMLELCQPGEDAHGYMGGKVSNTPYETMLLLKETDDQIKRYRQLGKVGNLSCQYRTSADTLRTVSRVQHRVILSDIEAKSLHATYRVTYRLVPQYWKRQIYTAKRDGWVETQAGRRVHVGTADTWPDNQRWGRESTAINFPIQGVGADQKYLGLMVLRTYLSQYGGRFYYELHDGLFAIVPDRYAEKVAVEGKKLLSNLPYKAAWGKVFPVEFPVDAKMGSSWGYMEGVHG